MTSRADRVGVRIGLISDTFTPQVNGVTTVLRRIVRAVADAGHLAVVVGPAYPRDERRDDPAELRIRSFPFPPYPSIRLSLPYVSRVERYLDQSRVELVHVATEGPLGFIGRRYALRRGIPLMTSFHTDFPRYCRDYGVPSLEPTVWRWLSWFHRPARLTHTPGEGTRAELLAHGLTNAVVWGRGVDTAHFHPDRRQPGWRRWLAAGDSSVVVLHVGRLAAEKNLDVLIESWRLAHRVLGQRAVFAIAGEGPLGARVRQALPFARVLGFLDRDSLAALYASSDLCVLPSRTETCGLVALEAMASGIPVIAADAGGLRESVRTGINGRLVPPDDAHAYLDAIVELVVRGDERRAMGAGARGFAVGRDARIEDAELLRQYHALTSTGAVEAPCAA